MTTSAPAAHQIRCGHCSTFSSPVYHASLAEVKACAARAHGFVEQQVLPEMPPERPAAIQVRKEVLDGLYTVVFEDGDYRTLSVRTQEPDASFMPGRKLVSYLSGPDNTGDYTTFANFDAKDGHAYIWKRFQAKEHEGSRLREALRVLTADPLAAMAAYGLRSQTCGMCHRPLTTPKSIERGIGPVCAKKMSAAMGEA